MKIDPHPTNLRRDRSRSHVDVGQGRRAPPPSIFMADGAPIDVLSPEQIDALTAIADTVLTRLANQPD